MAFKIYGSKSKWRPWVLDGGKRALKVAIPVIASLWVLVLLFNSIGMWGKDDTEMDREELPNFQGRKEELYSLDEMTESSGTSQRELDLLPRGIVEATSDMELRSLWAKRNSTLTDYKDNARCLLAIPVGIKLKKNVDMVAKKFFAENFTVILFHYDGNVDEWGDLKWHNKAIHIVAHNQSKWWFAKRFLHPDVISTYDYIFIWDEDLGVDNFHPGRFLKIMKEEGLEISQPALDPDLSEEIHHRITMRNKTGRVHRRIYGTLGGKKCSNESQGPPCTGWVEMMAPVFSRAAWRCAWHLIQNDLVHGWGLDMKLGYCAQGDRTKKVGVIDSEYIVHQGIQTLGGSGRKVPIAAPPVDPTSKANRRSPVDVRVEIRRQSGAEWETFKRRWDRAVKEDKDWVDPFRPKPEPEPEKSAATRPHMILSIVPRAISRLIPTRHGLAD